MGENTKRTNGKDKYPLLNQIPYWSVIILDLHAFRLLMPSTVLLISGW